MKAIPLLLALLAPAICASAPAQDSVYVESIKCVGGHYGLKLPADAAHIRAIGKLLHEEISEVEHWNDDTVTRTTLYFDGLELGIAVSSNDPVRWLITRAIVTSPIWNHIMPFRIAQPVSVARKVLGKSAKGDKDLSRTYGSEAGGLQFRTSAGTVTAITYSCYSG
jgi:hypothetical protein